MIKYSDLFVDWLYDLGYRQCFFVAGGNIMHLLDSFRKRMTCVPFIHEVSAAIAGEYANALEMESTKTLVLVTAGPGLTQAITGIAGAYLESRALLVVGGQVKSTDLSSPGLRQRGVQEIDGVSLVRSITVVSKRICEPATRTELYGWLDEADKGRKGPIFLEFCLDVQARSVERSLLDEVGASSSALERPRSPREAVSQITAMLKEATRPVLLLGGGISRSFGRAHGVRLGQCGIPIATSWNASDRLDARSHNYFGRPDTWGQRWANILIQQADLVVGLGCRFSLQQTGFNWQEFAPLARKILVNNDGAELEKGHPHLDLCFEADAEAVLYDILADETYDFEEWLRFGSAVRTLLPLDDPQNATAPGYLSPYRFVQALSDLCSPNDLIVPCSSGGANTVMMQTFEQKHGQVLINNKALASMGYGLAGAIGVASANRDVRTVLVEGDGGFAQNLQELGTVRAQNLNIKVFIFANDGYASIKMTQRNYFQGAYVGCDAQSGLGLPDWNLMFQAYGIPCMRLEESFGSDPSFKRSFEGAGPAAYLVPVDPEQTYYPKITSRVAEGGGMISQPLHMMSPPLPDDVQRQVMLHLPA